MQSCINNEFVQFEIIDHILRCHSISNFSVANKVGIDQK